MNPSPLSPSATPSEALPPRVAALVSLREARLRPVEEVGAKALHLSVAMALGHSVPAGVVIPVAALESGIAGDLLDEVWAEVGRMGGGPVAVRSSGVLEDGGEESYAGQFTTVLGVADRESLGQALRACLGSASGARVSAYGHGVAQPLAILVQRQVDPDASGVAFSANPVTGARDEGVIDAVRGLGERLVNGEVTPEQWVVRGEGPERTGGREHVLDAARAAAVGALARRLESEFGGPQDVEWAWAGGTLHVLQARPITALPPEPVPVPFDPPPGSWQRNDHHTTLSPMGFGLFCEIYDAAQAEAMRGYGVPIEEVRSVMIGGHLYSRMRMEGEGSGAPPPEWILWFISRLLPSMRRMNRRAREVFEGRLHHREMLEWEEVGKPHFRARIAEVDPSDLAVLDDAPLLRQWTRVLELFQDGVRAHARTIGNWVAMAEFCLFCREHLGWDHATCMSAMAGWSRATTIVRDSLLDLCREHFTPEAAREAVRRMEIGEDTWPAGPPAFASALEEWRRANVLRMQDYDLHNPTLGETPDRVQRVLRDALEGIAERRPDPRDRVTAAREKLHREAREALAGTPLDERFEELAGWARRAYGNRDENGFWTISCPFGLVRLHLLEIGRRMPGLASPAHVFYLTPEELEPAFRGELPNLPERVARRRGEEQWARFHRGPRRIGPPDAPMPPTRAFPPHLRKLFDVLGWTMEVEMDGAHGTRVDARTFTGRRASAGSHTGPVRRVRGPIDFGRVRAGDVVVCRITSPEWSILFNRVGALITEEGGFLSHPAIIAREFGIPAVVGADGAMAALEDGTTVTVDGDEGTVRILEEPGG